MKLKNIVMLVLALCMVFTLCACGGTNEVGNNSTNKATTPATTAPQETTAPVEKLNTYTIKVVDKEGNPMAGVKVQLCEESENGQCFLPVTTDENGVAVYEKEAGAYKAAINKMPAGYKCDKDYVYFGDDMEVTIELKPVVLVYEVTVQDQDGNPVSGVTLKVTGETNSETLDTSAEGKVSLHGLIGTRTVEVVAVPAAYAQDTTEYTFPETADENDTVKLTITLKPAA